MEASVQTPVQTPIINYVDISLDVVASAINGAQDVRPTTAQKLLTAADWSCCPDSEYRASLEKTTFLAEHILSCFLLFSLGKSDAQIGRIYDQHAYTFHRNKDLSASLVKPSSVPTKYLRCDGAVLCQLNTSDLYQAIKAVLEDNISLDIPHSFITLLLSNPNVLQELKTEIINDSEKLLPFDFVQSARDRQNQEVACQFGHTHSSEPMDLTALRQQWQTNLVSLKSSPPNFPINLTNLFQISGQLLRFFKSGELPDSNQLKCLLAMECWRAINKNADQFDGAELNTLAIGCLGYILKDVNQLDLTLVEFNAEEFPAVCQFLMYQFQGKAITFSKDNFKYCPRFAAYPWESALSWLLQFNPNLTSITFKGDNSHFVIDAIGRIVRAILSNPSITELKIDNRHLLDQGFIADSYLEGKTRHEVLIDELMKNSWIQVFDIGGWPDTEKSDRCNLRLTLNRELREGNKNYVFMSVFSEATGLPQDVVRLIFSIKFDLSLNNHS